ncbi:15470_t:CDS:2 [Cetraspora pellucida]|uniref:15470_t:CDS:1 n=1 Tax=Cetraspora pellucida TaxID=1433469 RepID=A0A9N9FPY5_9GLOM|nr:15470_t:CDS:2 [Cetraspora pellucida]
MKASNEAAYVVCISPKQYTSQKIYFLCKEWICKESEANGISPTGFIQYVNDYILPECIGGFQKKICLQIVERWLDILGCKCREYKKRIYFDGHEREDVVVYRSVFLDRLRTLEQRIAIYEGESMIKVLSVLNKEEQELVFVTHDKCIFYSNNGKKRIWVHDDEMPLRKKGNRRSIMVSKFLTEECGQLKLTDEEIEMYPDVLAEARCYFMPGKNQESYWMVDHLLDQIRNKVIPIFEAKFPNATAVFAFDNSTNHAAYAKDIFITSRINLGSEGNQPVM